MNAEEQNLLNELVEENDTNLHKEAHVKENISYIEKEHHFEEHDNVIEINKPGKCSDVVTTQSPINIVTKDCLRQAHPIHLCLCTHFEKQNTTVKIENNGYTAMVSIPEVPKPLILKGGPLKGEYKFDQLHFHWSDCDDTGSEHSIDGQKYASEAHLVHYNTKYGSFQEALEQPDGLVVIGVMMEISDLDNDKFDHVAEALYKIPCKNSQHYYTSRCFFEWLEEADFNEYVTYNGSLTTEPYSENAYWLLLYKPITISRNHMKAFRSLHIYDGKRRIQSNIRATQIAPAGLKIRYTGKMKPKSKL